MNPRLRRFAFAILFLSIASVLLVQSSSSTKASNEQVGLAPNNVWLPVQSGSSNSSTTSGSTLSGNMTEQNSTSLVSLASTSGATNSSLSYLQFQVTSLNEQMVAMSSTMQSLSQATSTNTLVSEAGLIVGILAFIAAIAVARRADALYHEAPGNKPGGSPPAGK